MAKLENTVFKPGLGESSGNPSFLSRIPPANGGKRKKSLLSDPDGEGQQDDEQIDAGAVMGPGDVEAADDEGFAGIGGGNAESVEEGEEEGPGEVE